MKTKIRTFIGLVALGLVGFTNMNATAGNKEVSTFISVEEEKNLGIEAWMLDNDLWKERSEAKATVNETEKALEVESWMINEDLFKAEASLTVKDADSGKCKTAGPP
jgi:hypothetical protein